MSGIENGNKLGGMIAESLGIKNCKKLILIFETDETAKVQAEFFIEKDGAMELPTIFEEYELVEKK